MTVQVQILSPVLIHDQLVMPGRYTAHIAMNKFLYIHIKGSGAAGPIPSQCFRLVPPLEQIAEAAE